ncbi:MAG: segregation/condensation protein A [Deltaproteobacteria bacterium]|nr:segregation/condensation protein A [Deltaproteobacteria bacterium]
MSDHPEADEYQVELPEFEGPLDLLLHLVKRHELNIVEIPIAFITEKYLEYLDLMRQLNLDVAGEYLLMAATLAHLKSRELLPRQDDLAPEENEDPDAPDPKHELIRRLLEYQRYKDAAEQISNRPTLGRQVFPRGVAMEPVDPSELPLQEVGTFALIAALNEVLQRSQVKLSYDVVIDHISISDRINSIVDRLAVSTTVPFLQCFDLKAPGPQLRHEIVVTFLAILEMAKLRMVRILQNAQDGEILIARAGELRSVEAEVEKQYS